MYKQLLIALVISLMILPAVNAQKPKKQMYTPDAPVSTKYKVDHRIDNMSYWRRMASLGLVPVQPDVRTPLGVYGTSKLVGRAVMTEDSPDVPVTTETSTQSENSIFVHPQNAQSLLQSNNSTTRPVGSIYGANAFLSADAGSTWGGSVNGAGGTNSGDPSTAISLSGRYYVGYIHSSGGQGVSYSTDGGVTWTAKLVAPSPPGWGSLLDKNHMWIDNSPVSPYEGNVYDSWTNFGGSNNNQIEISRTVDEGVTWSSAVNISSAVNAGSHNQGVNITTGPNGEVYVLWVIYDNWPSDEDALGFAKSLDGGATWQPATRIINNIRGIRNSGVGKNMRVNGFPTMTCDISNGPNSGTIYVTWCNIGVPGTNTGSDADVYMMKSTDQGVTWSTPLRVNQDAAGLGKKHYFPWITSDPVNGNLSVIYYDDRNVAANQCEVYVSNSSDGGATWWDMKVSDISFTPAPIAGLADGYFGDYLGNHARDGWVYPVWTDNRAGYAMTYVSPFVTGPPPNQPWLVYNDNSINDDATGNGNGFMDFGETTGLDLSIENQGDQPGIGVDVVLSTDNEYITITDNEESYGDIPIDAIVTKTNAFTFSVANNIPDATVVTFTIAATDVNDSTYYSNFNIEAHAPGFRTGLITLTEITGNGNNRLDPNEEATIKISTINTGDYKAYDVTGTLTTSSPYIVIQNPSYHWDSIKPGPMNSVLPVFNITVSPDAPIAEYAHFTYQINSEYHSYTKEFSYPIGLIVEDWETGNFSNFQWQFAGLSSWNITNENKYEGVYSARSGVIGNNATSEMNIEYNVAEADSISFYVKVSSEADYDFLNFYIDNTLVGQWSGEVNWQRVTFPVNQGNQVFRWIYSKDANTAEGDDIAWVDFIVFPPLLQTTAYAGLDGSTCERTAYMLNGAANNFVSHTWTTSGDGTFDDPSSLNAFYSPGGADITNGQVVLTLTVNGPEGELKTDNMVLSISDQAAVGTMADITLCVGSEVNLEAIASNYSGLNWTTSGTGSFVDPLALTTIYQPSTDDYTAGNVTLTLTAASSAPCGDALASFAVTFIPLPTATLSGQQTICAGETASAQISFTGTAPWSFEVSNGIGIIETSDNPYTLTVNPAETSNYILNYISDANGCQNTVEGSFDVTVNPLPAFTLTPDSTLCAGLSYTIAANASGDVNYFWTPGNMVTSSITVDSTGIGIGSRSYNVLVTDNLTGCSDNKQVAVTFEDCTGLDEAGSQSLVIYPNPTTGLFAIRIPGDKVKKYDIEIRDLNSRIVYSLTDIMISKAPYTIDVTSLSKGTYTLFLKEDKTVLSKKLIIQ